MAPDVGVEAAQAPGADQAQITDPWGAIERGLHPRSDEPGVRLRQGLIGTHIRERPAIDLPPDLPGGHIARPGVG